MEHFQVQRPWQSVLISMRQYQKLGISDFNTPTYKRTSHFSDNRALIVSINCIRANENQVVSQEKRKEIIMRRLPPTWFLKHLHRPNNMLMTLTICFKFCVVSLSKEFFSFFRLSNFSVNFHYQRLSFVTAIKTAIVTINSWSALETEAHRQGISRNLPGTVTSTSLKVKYYPAPKSFNESCNCSDNVAFHDNFTLLNNWTVSEGLA